MRTFSLLVASLGLAAGALALSTPSQQLLNSLDGSIHTTDSWGYQDCGQYWNNLKFGL
jgi:hypothetical protein